MSILWSLSQVLSWMVAKAGVSGMGHQFAVASSRQEVFEVLSAFYAVARWSFAVNTGGTILLLRCLSKFEGNVGGFTPPLPHALTWDLLLLGALMVAQKIIDDIPLTNCQFPKLREIATPSAKPSLELCDVNFIEVWLLTALGFAIQLPTEVLVLFGDELQGERDRGSLASSRGPAARGPQRLD